MLYSTRVMAVPCWNDKTGWQAELIKSPSNETITGLIWENKAAAQADAERLLESAAGLFGDDD